MRCARADGLLDRPSARGLAHTSCSRASPVPAALLWHAAGRSLLEELQPRPPWPYAPRQRDYHEQARAVATRSSLAVPAGWAWWPIAPLSAPPAAAASP